MIRKFISFFVVLSALFTACPVSADGVAAAVRQSQRPAVAQQKQSRIKVTPAQRAVIEAVQGRQKPRTGLRDNGQKLARLTGAKAKKTQRVNASGSTLQGWCKSNMYDSDGWYELFTDGTQRLLWQYEDANPDPELGSESFPFNVGFLRDGKIYAFSSTLYFYWVMVGHGVFTLDGEIVERHDATDLSPDLSTYVISCAYDATSDLAYVYTLNADGTGYMLQTVDPEAWTYDVVCDNVALEDVCNAFVWCPRDGRLYGITSNSRLVTVDAATGALTTLKKISELPLSTSLHGFVYSPVDKAFFLAHTADYETALYKISDDDSHEVTKMADMPDVAQCPILVSDDPFISDDAPAACSIEDILFDGGSLSGKARVTLPSTTFGGNSLSGTITVRVYVDDEELTSTTGIAGSTIEIALGGMTEGNHTFSFVAETGGNAGPKAARTLYVGYDTPQAPGEVTLTEGRVEWLAVTAGVNGGYIDTENLRYNVYLNDTRINDAPVSGTAFDFTMPDGEYSLYVASVEAVNGGNVSARGYSEPVKYGDAFTLPYTITPTESEGNLVTMIASRYAGYSWTGDYRPYEQCFTCYTGYDKKADEWLILPAVKITDTERLTEVACDVMAEEGWDETTVEALEVAYGRTADPSDMKVVKLFDRMKNRDYERYTAWFAVPESGDYYIAFHAVSEPFQYGIKLKNIAIKPSERPATTPTEPTSLSAKAKPEGELKADVTFVMPATDCAGSRLDSNSPLTATVTTPAEAKTVQGLPGSSQTVTVATVQGLNTITVSVSNSAEGMETATEVFTGIDIPKPISVMSSTTDEDNATISLKWEAPTTGVNGGYVNPADITYSLCLEDSESGSWEIVRDLGRQTSLDYAVTPVPEELTVAQVGILAQNAQGHCGVFRMVSEVVGKPYDLPMHEKFDGWDYAYNPVLLGDENTYTGYWGYSSDPSNFIGATTETGVMMAYPYSDDEPVSTARLILPKFSTVGADNCGIEFSAYCGPDAAPLKVYARSYGMEMTLIGEFCETSFTGWKKCRLMLPTEFVGRKWVEITIDAVFDRADQNAAMDYYKIKTFLDSDMEAVSVSAPAYMLTGTPATVTATVENAGLKAAAAPEVVCEIAKGGKALATLTMDAGESATLADGDRLTYRAEFTPTGDAVGDIDITVRIITADQNAANDMASAEASVSAGNEPVVTDLKADVDDGAVVLTWTEPLMASGRESFENFDSFSWFDRLGDFKCVDGDGLELAYFANFSFPGQAVPKAWQVVGSERMTEIISEAGYEDDTFTAADGDRFLMAMVPLSILVGEETKKADDWLISPEVREGSSFSFKLYNNSGGIEKVEVLCSTEDDDTAHFELMEALDVFHGNWKQYDYTLPAGARRFAIRYTGNTEYSTFICLDDITYDPMTLMSVVGYDIVRNGETIASQAQAPGSYVDKAYPAGSITYNVIPVVKTDETIERGLVSNTVVINPTGIGATSVAAVTVSGERGAIVVSGAEGLDLRVASADGRTVFVGTGGPGITVPVAPGVYVVSVGGTVIKVMVR